VRKSAILPSDAYWDPDVAAQDASLTVIAAGETLDPQVQIEVHTTLILV